MKPLKYILYLLSFILLTTLSRAQLVSIDGLALHTNIAVTTGAQLTVLGVFTNDNYTASNHNYVTQGDAWQPTGISKINSNFSYCSNQFILLLSLPNQINTNMASYLTNVINSLSNRVSVLSNTMALLTNNYSSTSNSVKFLALNAITNFDSSFSITGIVSGTLADNAHSGGTAGLAPIANGDGSWTWGQAGGLTNNSTGVTFTNFSIDGLDASDGSGNIISTLAGTSIFNEWTPATPSSAFGGPGGVGINDQIFQADRKVVFAGYGYDSSGIGIDFELNGNGLVRYGPGTGSGTLMSLAPGGFQIDAPGIVGGTFNVNPYAGSPTDGYVGIQQPSPAYVLDVAGTFACDTAQIYSDGSGNLTAQTFNPISDRGRKENIQILPAATALQMALSLTNYSWRFKAVTNWISHVTQTTNGIALHGVTLVTNLTAKVRPASGREFGPMAQEWHAATGLGGGTNISVTSMAGLLLGAVQGLAARCATNSAGAATTLPLADSTSQVWFVHVDTNGSLTASRTP